MLRFMANERHFSSIKLYFFFFFQSTRETALKGCFLLYQDGGGQGDEAGYVILQLALIISISPNVVLFNPSLQSGDSHLYFLEGRN